MTISSVCDWSGICNGLRLGGRDFDVSSVPPPKSCLVHVCINRLLVLYSTWVAFCRRGGSHFIPSFLCPFAWALTFSQDGISDVLVACLFRARVGHGWGSVDG